MGVLVAEDNEDLRDLLVEILRGMGVEVRAAPDGEVALDKMRAERPDAVILDYFMPKLSGLQVIATMRSESSLKHIPVIIITGMPGLAVPSNVVLVEKPFSPSDILRALARVRMNDPT